MLVLTAENMKKAEESAVEHGSDYCTLMTTAGSKCADVIANEDKNKKITVLCGKGRNGGDGFVIASRLWSKGFRNVFVLLVYGEPTDELCVRVFGEMQKYSVNIDDWQTEKDSCIYHINTADVLVDAVFGIGFKGELKGNAKDAVECANANETAVKYAIDIPSGLSANGENPENLHFNADYTLTMIALKPCQVFEVSKSLCGKISVMDIGVNDEIIMPFAEPYFAYTKQEAVNNIADRKYNSNKGTFGSVLTVCGSKNMVGCVFLCNQAAVEIGAGLVTAAFPDCAYDAVTAKLTEPLFLPLECNKDGRILPNVKTLLPKIETSDVVAVGCGLGVDNATKDTVKFIIENCKSTLILDADALNCIAISPDVLKNAQCDIIVTPHPGEMSRLTKKSIAEIQGNRIKTASDFAKEYGVTVILKGVNTVVAGKNGEVYINTTGNAGMARGGSGDVLTGLVAGLVKQTKNPFTAACTAVYIHGSSGDYIKEKQGILAVTPTRLIEGLTMVLQ